jgi:hypothetical protein
MLEVHGHVRMFGLGRHTFSLVHTDVQFCHGLTPYNLGKSSKRPYWGLEDVMKCRIEDARSNRKHHSIGLFRVPGLRDAAVV